MTREENTHTAIKEPVRTKKRITLKEYLKSILFLAAVYTLILNKALDSDSNSTGPAVETSYIHQSFVAETKNRQFVLPSWIYSAVSISFYPTQLIWK